jgi:thiosulfate reductase cytochrome b subunit
MHPALYLGDDGHKGVPSLLSVSPGGAPNRPLRSTLQIGRHVFDSTGILGFRYTIDGEQADLALPLGLVFPPSGELGLARGWHFLMAWVLLVNIAIYVIFGIATGHFRRNFVPTMAQLRPSAILRDLWDHVRLKRPRGVSARSYNLLQRLTYGLVVFVLVPLQVLSGLTMSSSFGAIAPQLYDFFGGRQSARTVHFVIMVGLVVFFLVHMMQVFVAGVRNEVGSMITGRFTVPSEENSK